MSRNSGVSRHSASLRYALSRLLPVGLVGLVGLVGCGAHQIFPINAVSAIVYGRASLAGVPLARAQLTAKAIPGACTTASVATGITQTDADGQYRVQLTGNAANGLYCLRVSVGVGPGDTIIVRDSVRLGTAAPFDSVRVDVQR